MERLSDYTKLPGGYTEYFNPVRTRNGEQVYINIADGQD